MNEQTLQSVIETKGVAAGKSFNATLKLADLNWEPKEDKVAGMGTAIEMPRFKMLYRSDTKAPLGIVGQDYSASSPKSFLESQYEFAEFSKGDVVRAGFIPEKSRAFAFVEMPKIEIPREKREVGDIVRAFIYSTDGWDGGTPSKSRLYLERLKCKNGMTSRQIKSTLWVSHTKNREKAYADRYKTFLNEVAAQMTELQEQFQRLANSRMTEVEMLGFAKQLLPSDSGRADNTRIELVNLFNTGIGNEGRTRWDAYNAVTQYVTHGRSYRETDVRSADTNRFLGVLERDTLNDKALGLLLSLTHEQLVAN